MPGRRDGATLVAASRARVAVLPAWVVTSFAVLPAWVVTPLAVLPAFVVTSLAALPACAVTSLVALRPALADFLSTSATWLARDSSDFGSMRSSWVATSWRTSSRTCSLDLRLRSTKLSTHSCAWLRWMSPAFTNSRTISSARPRLTCPRTVPASRYLRMRSLLAIEQEYPKC